MFSLLRPPASSDRTRSGGAPAVHDLVSVMLAGITALLLIASIIEPQSIARWFWIGLSVNSIGLGVIALNRRGHSAIASRIFVGAMVVFFTIVAWTRGGVTAPTVIAYFPLVVVAGALLTRRETLVAGGACALAGLLMALAEIFGFLHRPAVMPFPLARWAAITLWLFVMIGLQQFLHARLQRAFGELRRREGEFRAVFERAAVGIVVVDGSRHILSANPAFESMLGYTADELQRLPFGATTHFEDRELDHHFYEELAAGLRESYQVEKRFLRKDGTIVWGRLTASLTSVVPGETPYGLAIVEDITDRNRLSAQLRQAQKMEAVGHLAGGISHDFNNLLTVINGYSDMLLDQMHESDPALPMVREIKSAGDRAASLTQQLLAFSRKTVLEPQVFEVNALIVSLQKLLRRVIGEQIQLDTCLKSPSTRVKADPRLLEQAIVNMAVNARDAMPNGGSLVLETQEIEIDSMFIGSHSGARPGRYALIAVNDNGCGMDPSTRERIFEPFFTTKEVGKGTGLGLAMVYGFVKQSGGYIDVYSQAGIGTTFKLYLPIVADEEPASSDLDLPANSKIAGHETILLAEDEEPVRRLTRRVLEASGFQVLEASNGLQAIQTASEYEGAIHILVSDIVMPEMTGVRAAASLRILRPEMKFLFLSGYTDDAAVRNGVLEAETAFLQKPFSPHHLALKVREVLDSPATKR